MAEFISLTATSDALQLVRYFDGLASEAPKHAKYATSKAGHRIRAEIQAEMHETGRGVHWPGLPHPSSAPGQPPARQSGSYSDSWGVTLVPELNGGWSAVIGTDAEQGVRLEFGFIGIDAAGRSYDVAPRPHVGPAVDKWGPVWAEELYNMAVHA